MASALPRRPRAAQELSPSSLTIRNIVVAGHRTSVRLEPVMWEALRDISRVEQVRLNDLVTQIDRQRDGLSLTAAIRVHIVDFYRNGARLRPDPAAVRVASGTPP